MLAADDSGAWKVVEAAMASGTSAEAVYTTMLIPALRRVGEEWRAGNLDIAAEHAASRVAERVSRGACLSATAPSRVAAPSRTANIAS